MSLLGQVWCLIISIPDHYPLSSSVNYISFFFNSSNNLAEVERSNVDKERSGSVVECLTRDRGAAGSSLTGVIALWSLRKTHLS